MEYNLYGCSMFGRIFLVMTMVIAAVFLPLSRGFPREEGAVNMTGVSEDFDNIISHIMMDEEHIKQDVSYHHDGKHSENPQFELDMSEYTEPKQLLFLYFQEHDFDQSGSLDGLEIYKAMTHLNEHHKAPVSNQPVAEKKMQPRKREALIDMAFLKHDLNDDGYLTWEELRSADDHMNLMQRSLGTSPLKNT